MTTIKTKRVYEPISPQDGLLVLVDRLWPRGISRERMHGVIWAKDIAPSKRLREWFHEDIAERWNEFGKKYEKELENNGAVRNLLTEIEKHDTVTLLFAGRDTVHTHAVILQAFLERELHSRMACWHHL